MIYTTITGLHTDNQHIIAGILAGIIMFIFGSILIAVTCAILSAISDTISNILHTSKSNEDIFSAINDTPLIKPEERAINSTTTQITTDIHKTTFTVDPYFASVGRTIIKEQKADVNFVMNEFHIGIYQAIHIMGQLRKAGVIGPDPTNPEPGVGKVLMTAQEFELFLADAELVKESIDYSHDIYYDSTPSPSYNYDSMEGHQFEHFCAALFKQNNFHNVTVTQDTGDQGIDILAEKNGVKYAIQCKCYSSDIGNKAVQEAFAGCRYYNCHVPVVMTNRYFTKQAKDLAQKTNVLLWDRDILNKYIQVSQGGKL